MPVNTIRAMDVLTPLKKIETRGAIDSTHSVRRLCGQILRFAVASGLAKHDVTVDLKGALSVAIQTHRAAITEPKQVGELLRAISAYSGHPYAVAALKLSPLVFLRPGELRSAEWADA